MRKGNMKKILVGVAVAALTVGSAMTSYAGTWQFDGPEDWQRKYVNDDGNLAGLGWQEIDGKWYHFDEGNYLDIGIHAFDGKLYCLSRNPATIGQWEESIALWMWTVGADGSPVINYDVMYADFDDWFASEFREGETMEAHVARWAQASDRGAAWKALFDKYALPYNIADGLNSANRNKTITFTTAPDVTNGDVSEVITATEMMIWLNTDGMANASLYGVHNADGSITVTGNITMGG